MFFEMKKLIPLFVMFFCAVAVFAQNNSLLKVTGEVNTPLNLKLEDLSSLPQISVILNDKEGKPHTYSGVLVSELLRRAGATLGKTLRGENLSKYLLVKCADGYEVLFSLAELDSDFTDRKVILADKLDGSPLPASKGPLRVVVEGEKKPARSSYQVVELIVGNARR